MADRWSGPVGRLGSETSDGRLIESDGFYSRSLPLPLDWQEYTEEAHDKAVTVGTIDTVELRDGGVIWASGEWLDEAVIPKVAPARLLVDQGVVYPSVQAAGCEVEYRELGGGMGTYVDGEFEEGEPYRVIMAYTSFELAKVTLVAVQAAPDLRISTDTEEMASLIAAGVRSSGWGSLPIADTGQKWDGPGAAGRVAQWAGVDEEGAGQAAWDKYARAFLWQDPDADPQTKGAYKLGVADVIDGDLTIVPRGVYAVAGVLNGARGGADIPEAQQGRLKSTVSGLYERIAKAADDDTIKAPFSLVASAEPEMRLPHRSWFDEPVMTEYTPLTITPDGRVFGMLAPWDFEHIGVPGATCPASRTGYAYFHLGATMTDGGEVATGKLTVGGGHADGTYGYMATAEHYDNVGTAVATVRVGENEFGVWVAGALVADATPNQVETLRQSPLSGDWRDIGGNLELVAAHAVNVPGFPIPRARQLVASGGRTFSLLASARVPGAGAVPPGRPSRDGAEPTAEYVRSLAAQLAQELRPVEPAVPAMALAEIPEGFDFDAEDLRAEFTRMGVAWPSISATVDGVALPAFEVAEGCVRGMLAQASVPGPVVAVEGTVAPTALALALAEAKLRVARRAWV
jgi:hypothetical protein